MIRIYAVVLAICLAYLWYHATPHGRHLLAALGVVACVVVIGASAVTRR